MKKMLVCVALIAAATTVNAQKFKLGLGGAFNSTWLMNKNVFDADDRLDVDISFGGNFGLKAQYYFNDKVGLELDVLKAGHNQKYEGKVSGITYKGTDKLRYLDVPLLLRLGGDKGGYFEFGPNFGFLTKATTTGSGPDVDTKNSFNSTNIGILLGFGVDVDASESFTITAGLRIGYGFNDVTKEYKAGSTYEESIATANAQIDGDNMRNYKATSRLWGGLSLGVLYTIPTGGKTAAK